MHLLSSSSHLTLTHLQEHRLRGSFTTISARSLGLEFPVKMLSRHMMGSFLGPWLLGRPSLVGWRPLPDGRARIKGTSPESILPGSGFHRSSALHTCNQFDVPGLRHTGTHCQDVCISLRRVASVQPGNCALKCNICWLSV